MDDSALKSVGNESFIVKGGGEKTEKECNQAYTYSFR